MQSENAMVTWSMHYFIAKPITSSTCRGDGTLTVDLFLGQNGPGDARHLVGQCDCSNLCRLARQWLRQPRVLFGMGARLLDHGKGPDNQDAPQVSIALLGD